MASFKFNLDSRELDKIKTNHRCIKTELPVKESIKLLDQLKQYESTNAIEQLPVIWDKAINHQIFDPYGNIWIDFTSSIFVTNSGHANSKMLEKILEVLKKPLTHSYYYPTEIRLNFLKKLIEISPNYIEKAILLSAGTEATERAIKIAKIYGKSKSKNKIISWEGNYHGKTLNAQMISGQFNDHAWIENFDENIIHLPFPYPWNQDLSGKELFYEHLEIIKSKGVELSNISSFFVESFQGWGAIFYPHDYIKELKIWSKENEALLIFDEIQAGFYRTGKLFAFEHYGVEADLVICGKGISGSLPLSAVLGKKDLIELDSAYTSTHGGHPLSCAAGLGNLEFLDDKNLHIEVKKKSDLMKSILEGWISKYPKRIKMVLGEGMLYGVFIYKANSDELDNDLVNRICERAMEKGVFSICTGRGTLKLGPPLTIPEDALIEGLNVYEECFKELF